MANQQYTATIKLNGVDVFIKSAQEARKHIEQLISAKNELELQMQNEPEGTSAQEGNAVLLEEMINKIAELNAVIHEFESRIEAATSVFENLSPGEQTALFLNLGQKSLETLQGVDHLIKSLGVTAEEAAHALAEVEQAIALIEATRSTAEKMVLQRRAMLLQALEDERNALAAQPVQGERILTDLDQKAPGGFLDTLKAAITTAINLVVTAFTELAGYVNKTAAAFKPTLSAPLPNARGGADEPQELAGLKAATQELERQNELVAKMREQAAAFDRELELMTAQYKARRIEIQEWADRQATAADIEIAALEAQQASLGAKLKNNLASDVNIDNLMAESKEKIELLNAQKFEIQIKADLDTKALDAEEIHKKATIAAQQINTTLEDSGRQLGGAFTKGLANALQGSFVNIFKRAGANDDEAQKAGFQAGKAYAEKFVGAAGQLGSRLLELQDILAQNAIAKYKQEADFFQQQAEATQERIDELNATAQDSAQTILNLEQEITTIRGANAAALQTQLNAETERRSILQQQIVKQEREKAKFEQQKVEAANKAEAIQKRQAVIEKVLSVSKAIINTAEGVTAALTVPPPVGIALAAVVGALGAAQVATISAQPVSAAEGGILTAEGGVEKLAAGGIVQGPSHREGGVRGVGRFGNIEVEGGEAIIPRRATELNRPLVEQLIREGSARQIFESGGIVERIKNLDTSPDIIRGDALGNVDNTVNRLADVQAALIKMGEKPTVVSVVDINEGQNRVKVVDRNAGL